MFVVNGEAPLVTTSSNVAVAVTSTVSTHGTHGVDGVVIPHTLSLEYRDCMVIAQARIQAITTTNTITVNIVFVFFFI
jgi:hypothetical protein